VQHYLVVLLCVATALTVSGQGLKRRADCPQSDRVIYSAAAADAMQNISVEAVSAAVFDNQVRGLESEQSTFGTATFFIRKPDTTRPGPWNTAVFVRGNAARPISLAITLTDHATYDVRVRWLNEKLLFLQVWRGRIVSTDLILDVETRQFVYREAANYNALIVPCEDRGKR
jgi:hypothetical protein